MAEEVVSPGERRRLEGLGLEVWAPGERSHWLPRLPVECFGDFPGELCGRLLAILGLLGQRAV